MSSAARPHFPALLQTLIAEADAVREFVDILTQEQDALRTTSTDELPGLVEKKSVLGTRLNELAVERNALLTAEGFPADRSGIEACCKSHPEQAALGQAWDTIVELALRARELNRVNGELINLHLQYNTKALEALRSGHSALSLYGPDGQTQTSGGPRINDAA